MTGKLTIAIAKGYLLKEGLKCFKKIGIDVDPEFINSRKLMTTDKTGNITILKIRPWDVPEYVKEGAADLGIVGIDVLDEKKSQVNRLIDLKFGECKLVLAGPKSRVGKPLPHYLNVATKFTSATQNYFFQKGIKANIIKLYGAIELAPLTGLADVICDLTATGATLKEHNLHIIDTVLSSSAVLISNPMSERRHFADITSLVEQLKRIIK